MALSSVSSAVDRCSSAVGAGQQDRLGDAQGQPGALVRGMAGEAMREGMRILGPHLKTNGMRTTGKVVLGTVKGDLHDIGKNLVAMMIEGGGWEVIDLGVDVGTEKFLRALDENPGAVIGLSALLTTTMENMKKTVAALKEKHPGSKILIGGAPVTQEYCDKIGADFYSPDPQGAVNYLKQLVS